MEPMLLWAISGMSALLLVTAGLLLARARGARMVAAARRDAEQVRAAYADLESRYRRLAHQAEQTLDASEQAQARARGPAATEGDVRVEASGFDEATVLPEPADFFRKVQAADSVPRLDRVAQDEFAIQDAAPKGVLEETDSGLVAPAPGEATRQFNLHSPEAVVHFLQRIDELTEENRELKALLAEREQTIAGQRAEGSEQAQRFAALDATMEKLRQELRRRNQRIAQLEGRLRDALGQASPGSQKSKDSPRSLVQVLSASQGPPGDRGGAGPSVLEAPTVQVPRLDEKDILPKKG